MPSVTCILYAAKNIFNLILIKLEKVAKCQLPSSCSIKNCDNVCAKKRQVQIALYGKNQFEIEIDLVCAITIYLYVTNGIKLKLKY